MLKNAIELISGLAIGFLGQMTSFALFVKPVGLTSIWIPGGVVLALLMLWPRSRWPWLLTGFAVGGSLAFVMTGGRPVYAGMGYAWMVLCIVLGVELLRRRVPDLDVFADIRSFILYFLLIVGGMACVSALGAVLVVMLAGGRATFPESWLIVAPAHAASYLLLTPVMLGLARRPLPWTGWTRLQGAEFALLCAVPLFLSFLLPGLPLGMNSVPFMLLVPVPFMLLVALRFDHRAACLALLVSFVPAAVAALKLDAISVDASRLNMIVVQLWMITVGLFVQVLSLQSEQRRRVQARLQSASGEAQLLARRLIVAQESERSRIARELHDDVNQRLVMAARAIDAVQSAPADERDRRVAGIRQGIVELMEDVRRISHDLHPSVLEHAGLEAALETLVEEVGASFPDNATFNYALQSEPPADVALAIYRIAQEATRNAVLHSGARRLDMRVECDAGDRVLVIRDDGRGMHAGVGRDRAGMGLSSIRERARQFGGSVLVESSPGTGTRIEVRIPKSES